MEQNQQRIVPEAPRERTRLPILERYLNPAASNLYDNEYLRLSSTMTYSYLVVIPLVLLYEVGIRIVTAGAAAPVRVSADIMVDRALEMIGLSGTSGFAIALILVGIATYFYEKRHALPLRPRYIGWMYLEGLFWGVALGFLVGFLVSGIVPGLNAVALEPPLLQAGTTGSSPAVGFFLSLGAGVYEELIFRLILVTLLYLLLQLVKIGDLTRYGIAAVIGAVIFSWVHYVGPLGDPFLWESFMFRFLMGLAFNALLIARGFGIAVAAHALYDVVVTVL